jgi:hypothetical protein
MIVSEFNMNSHKIILIMGESGPATLAGCESYLSQPEIFEQRVIRGNLQKRLLKARYQYSN